MPAIEYARFEYFQRTSGEIRRVPFGHQLAELLGGRELEGRPVRARFARQARAMREQLFDGDRRILGFGQRDREPRQVLRDRIVEAQQSPLAQLHDGGGGEQLAVRRHAELGLRRHRHLAGGVGKAESLRPDQFLVGDDADGDARQVARDHLPLEPHREQPLRRQHVGVASDVRGRRLRTGWDGLAAVSGQREQQPNRVQTTGADG